MEKLICLFHKIGCSGKEPWEHSELRHLYFAQVRQLWTVIKPYVANIEIRLFGGTYDSYFFYDEIAHFIYDGYRLLFIVGFGIWKFFRAKHPYVTNKQMAWFVLKWGCFFALLFFAFYVWALAFSIMAVAEGVAKPAIVRRMRW